MYLVTVICVLSLLVEDATAKNTWGEVKACANAAVLGCHDKCKANFLEPVTQTGLGPCMTQINGQLFSRYETCLKDHGFPVSDSTSCWDSSAASAKIASPVAAAAAKVARRRRQTSKVNQAGTYQACFNKCANDSKSDVALSAYPECAKIEENCAPLTDPIQAQAVTTCKDKFVVDKFEKGKNITVPANAGMFCLLSVFLAGESNKYLNTTDTQEIAKWVRAHIPKTL